MRTRFETISLLTDPGLIAVVRTEHTRQVMPICEALLAGGIHAVELTMTVPDALTALREAAGRFGKHAAIGMGTLLSAEMARAAIQAGAQFVVSPVTKVEIIDVAHAVDRPVLLGAYTPTEAQLAWEAGADFIKIFPADNLGPGYIKALRAPLPDLRIVPTGGVNLQTAADFLQAGCAALGVGSALVSAQILREENWAELTRMAKVFVEAVRTVRGAK
ncbi:MAG TPA: bifunctional 4-hydroxy-2-oxoglutarate aldolase/2-dehydro-3-deoxy-phosphogluconate aldolase [Verrucomicrobiae bacterium]|jgi:2-dehydro-3-deoxyphosphogluconate aldolase/(4S)-4-hydroxy-2-oxoglutarate aldolase